MVLNSNSKLKDNSIGQFFTPGYIAKFMVKNIQKFFPQTENKKELRVLEPSAGKGVFLKYLLKEHFNNITAYELDNNLFDQLLNLFPEINFRFENFLGSNPQEKYDVVIGNPPYLGQNYNAKIFQEYVKLYPTCAKYFVGNMDLFYFFIHLGILKLTPGGVLSFITTNYWITKSDKTGIKLLKPHILDECYIIQYVDLTNLNIFENAAGQHNSIFVLQKKTEKEKAQNLDKNIEVIYINKNKNPNLSDNAFNQKTFRNLIQNRNSDYIEKFISSTTNKNLKPMGSWNLVYPEEVKRIITNIEKFCITKNRISYLKDYFIIRNGLIFIKDDIFILKQGVNLRIEDKDIFIKIGDNFYELNDDERNRLKKIYKSKSIQLYGYDISDCIGYAIFLNKNEFFIRNPDNRNKKFEEKYPTIIKYLKHFEKDIQAILINAKENPKDVYFPRRGSFIRILEKNQKERLIDLELSYDNGKKIFLKYISNENVFGYTDNSYYATSDTYFLWPKISENDLDYLFIIAYLNSKIVNFLFKAKKISIKRSKTKLEKNLPIPNLNKFKSKKNLSIIKLIKLLTSWLIEKHNLNRRNMLINIKQKFSYTKRTLNSINHELLNEIEEIIENENASQLQNIIDILFFELFNIIPKEVENIIQKYYQY